MRSSTSDQEAPVERPTEQQIRPWLFGLLVMAVLIALPIVLALATVILTGNLDPAYRLGISDELFNGLLLGASGAVTGAVAGSIRRLAGVRLVAIAAGASIVGTAIYLSFLGFGLPDPPASDRLAVGIILVGQGLAIWLGLRFAGFNLLGGLAVLLAVGVGVSGFIASQPEPPAEVVLVLAEFEATGSECRGSGALKEVVAGSELLLLEFPETTGSATEIGSVRLPVGTVVGGGCVFELGHPLERPTRDYANIDFFHESDPDVAQSTAFEGDRIVIRLGVD